MKYIIYFLVIILIFPFVLPAQESDDNLNPYDPSAELNITTMLLRKAIGMEEFEPTIQLGGTHNVYDNFGNFLMRGVMLVDFSRYRNPDELLQRGGRYAWELQQPFDDATLKSDMQVSFSVPIRTMLNKIFVGRYISMLFTPFTFNKNSDLFGVSITSTKIKSFEFKTFATTRFNMENLTTGERTAIDDNDRYLIAHRGIFSLKWIFNSLTELPIDFLYVIRGINIGYSYVYESLRNGMMDDSNSTNNFLKNYNYGDTIDENDEIVGFDTRGKILNINYSYEYAKLVKNRATIGDFNYDNIKDFQSEKLTGEATYLYFKSENFPVFKWKIGDIFTTYVIEKWNVGENYLANFAVDDNDDKDEWADDNYDDDEYFPYQRGDTDYDEPNTGVIPKIFNKNENTVPDYKEDFLNYENDHQFLIPMDKLDRNHNNVIDIEENDNLPDYPYKRARRGYSLSLNFVYSDFTVDANHFEEYSTTNNNRNIFNNLYLLWSKVFPLPFANQFNVEFFIENVKDNMPDDVIVNGVKTYDKLWFINNLTYNIGNSLKIEPVKGLVFLIRNRFFNTKRYYDDIRIKKLESIFKLSYTFKIKKWNIFSGIKYDKNKIYYNTIPNNIELLKSMLYTEDIIGKEVIYYNLVSNIRIQAGFNPVYHIDRLTESNNYFQSVYLAELKIHSIQNEGNFWKNKDIVFVAGYKKKYIDYSSQDDYDEDIIYLRIWANL